MHFCYDGQGRPTIVNYNGAIYHYVYNLQGDVIALLDDSNSIVVEYKYDAWGKPLGKTGSLATTLGTLNPFRYRGYVYDEETGLYYLRSRYYNPEWGRFISADALLGKTGKLLSHNLYSYCRNKPISYYDSDGDDAIWIQERASAFELGHSGLMVQDEDNNWYYFYWGAPKDATLIDDIIGITSECCLQYVDIGTFDLHDTESLKEALSRNGGLAAERSVMITDTFYFNGDYSATYSEAKDICGEDQSYNMLISNCVQKTLRAFIAGDERFIHAMNSIRTASIPNDAVTLVSMMPSEKERFPWGLFITSLFM